MTKLVYRKDNGDTSKREVIPIGFHFGDRDSVLCLDLSRYDAKERERRKKIAEELRKEFIKAVQYSDLQEDYRSFFLDNIEEIE